MKRINTHCPAYVIPPCIYISLSLFKVQTMHRLCSARHRVRGLPCLFFLFFLPGEYGREDLEVCGMFISLGVRVGGDGVKGAGCLAVQRPW